MGKNPSINTATMGKAASIAVLIMAASNILSRLLGFVRIKTMAQVAGATANVDAYVFAFIIPDMINHFLAGSALSITFIPIFQKYFLDGREPKDGWQFFSNLFTTGTLVFALAILLSVIYTDKILFFAGENIKSSSNPEIFALTVKLTRIILPAQLFFFWGALLNGVQYANKRFLLPALTPICYNLGIILCGILLYRYVGIAGFSWGVLLGAFVGNVAVQIPGALKVGMKYRFIINPKDKDLRIYTIKTIPFIAGLTLVFSNELFLKLFGSYAKTGEGSIATLDYSYKIFFMLVGLLGQSVAAGVYPFLSQLALEKRIDELKKLLHALTTKIIIILIPISVLLFVISNEAISILLRGGEFTASDVVATSKNFQFYLIGAYFCALVLVVNRVYFAMQSTYTPLIITSLSVIFTIPFFFFFSEKFGAPGVALATSLSAILMGCSLYGYWSWKNKNRLIFSYILHTFGVYFISFIGGYFAWYIGKISFLNNLFINSHYLIKSLFQCIIQTIPSLLLVVFLLHITKLLTLSDLKKLLSKKKAG